PWQESTKNQQKVNKKTLQKTLQKSIKTTTSLVHTKVKICDFAQKKICIKKEITKIPALAIRNR
ncbi:hypothetical protein HMPREF1583_00617, partial [Gardnerella vaginalis JCP8151B]